MSTICISVYHAFLNQFWCNGFTKDIPIVAIKKKKTTLIKFDMKRFIRFFESCFFGQRATRAYLPKRKEPTSRPPA